MMAPSSVPSPSKGSPSGDRRAFEVGPDSEGDRLDRWLSERVELSRTRVAALIESGDVLLNGVRPRKAEPLAPGDRIEMSVPEPEPITAEAEDLPLEIVYEDEDLLVVNKPAGMVVHPAKGHPRGTLVNALLHHVTDLSGIGGKLRPGIVHRLDRETSGLLVVAKNDPTHQALSDALRKRKVRRLYRALSWGHLSESPLTIDAPLGRDPAERTRRAVVADGKRAVTHARVVDRLPAAELLDVALETGRTHQIRVHLAHIGHPIVGDETYGAGWSRGMSGAVRGWARELEAMADRQFLHARRLAFRHPSTGELLDLRIPLPPDLERIIEWAHGKEDR